MFAKIKNSIRKAASTTWNFITSPKTWALAFVSLVAGIATFVKTRGETDVDEVESTEIPTEQEEVAPVVEVETVETMGAMEEPAPTVEETQEPALEPA